MLYEDIRPSLLDNHYWKIYNIQWPNIFSCRLLSRGWSNVDITNNTSTYYTSTIYLTSTKVTKYYYFYITPTSNCIEIKWSNWGENSLLNFNVVTMQTLDTMHFSPIFWDVSNPELGSIPWHVWMGPLNPCYPFPLWVNPRKCIEITASN